jgi:hypothetical protein
MGRDRPFVAGQLGHLLTRKGPGELHSQREIPLIFEDLPVANRPDGSSKLQSEHLDSGLGRTDPL